VMSEIVGQIVANIATLVAALNEKQRAQFLRWLEDHTGLQGIGEVNGRLAEWFTGLSVKEAFIEYSVIIGEISLLSNGLRRLT